VIVSGAEPTSETDHTQRTQRAYREAREQFQGSTNAIAAWQFARACFDWAELASTDKQRAAIAEEGIAAARLAHARDPSSAEAYYYLGLTLGQLARTKTLGALRLLDDMERAWERSIQLDPKFDYAGAHRSLGMLYRDAPGWPASIGNRGKARFHLEKCVELSPDYPDNRLSLFEAYLEWGQRKAVAEQIPAVQTVLDKAREKLTGPDWAQAWKDWDERWKKMRSKVGVTQLRSPAHSKR
jgi:tetratricopeptide (TPR) repeat protein